MGKIALLVVFMLVIAIPAFAQVDIDGPHHTLGIGSNAQAGATASSSASALGIGVGVGIARGGDANATVFNTNMIGNGFGNFSPSAEVRNYYSPTNFNVQGQDQRQGQLQGQDQGQGQSQMNNWKQVFVNPRQFQNIPELVPFNVPLLKGKVGNWTEQMVSFAVIKPYRGEPVIAVRVFSGCIFDRIRLEDIEEDLLAKFKIVTGKKNPWYSEKGSEGWPSEKVRYLVQFKDSAKGAGIGGGGQLGGSGMSGDQGISGMGSILPGYNRSTADPMYIIKFLLIQ